MGQNFVDLKAARHSFYKGFAKANNRDCKQRPKKVQEASFLHDGRF